MKVLLSVKSDSATPSTVAHQAPLSMGLSRQEYWSGLPFPPRGDLPDAGIEPRSPALQADCLLSEPPGKPLGGPNNLTIWKKFFLQYFHLEFSSYFNRWHFCSFLLSPPRVHNYYAFLLRMKWILVKMHVFPSFRFPAFPVAFAQRSSPFWPAHL